jgi:Skp family chaperone for outer membrane proteins
MTGTRSSHWSRSLTILCLCATAIPVAWQTARAREAESAAPQKTTGVAIVNLKQVFERLDEYKQGMKFIGDQSDEMQPRVEELKGKLTKLETDISSFPKDGNTVELLKLKQQRFEIETQLKSRVESLRLLLRIQAGDVLRQVFDKVTDAADRLAKEDGWDIVMVDDRDVKPPERVPGENGSEGRGLTDREVENVIQQRHIIAAAKRVDITDALVVLMNNEFKNPPKKQ